MFGYSAYVCIFAIWQTSSDTAVGSFFVPDATCYSPLGHDHFGKDHLCASGHAQLFKLCHVIQNDMLNDYHSPFHLFCLFHFSLQHSVRFGICLSCSNIQSTCNFLSPDVFVLQMLHSATGICIFGVWGFLYPVVECHVRTPGCCTNTA